MEEHRPAIPELVRHLEREKCHLLGKCWRGGIDLDLSDWIEKEEKGEVEKVEW